MCSYWEASPGVKLKIGKQTYEILDRSSRTFTLKTLTGRFENNINTVDKDKLFSWNPQKETK